MSNSNPNPNLQQQTSTRRTICPNIGVPSSITQNSFDVHHGLFRIQQGLRHERSVRHQRRIGIVVKLVQMIDHLDEKKQGQVRYCQCSCLLPIVIRYSSDIHPIFIRYSSDIHPIFIRSTPLTGSMICQSLLLSTDTSFLLFFSSFNAISASFTRNKHN
jgi:hypothetical protein